MKDRRKDILYNPKKMRIHDVLKNDKKILEDFDFDFHYKIDWDVNDKDKYKNERRSRGGFYDSQSKATYQKIQTRIKKRGTKIEGIPLELVYAYMSRNRDSSFKESVHDLISKGFREYRRELLVGKIVHLLAQDLPLIDLLESLIDNRPLRDALEKIMKENGKNQG